MTISAAAYVRAQTRRTAIARDVVRTFDSVDLLLMPTVPTDAPAVDLDLDQWRGHVHHGILGALAGLPGVSVPMGLSANGLPLGLAIVGPPGGDGLVLHAARAFQRETDWHLQPPPTM